jgi:hypothetical protein
MHGNRAFNNHIRVLLSRVELFVLAVKFVEAHLNASTARQFLLDWARLIRILSSCVVLTLNLILVSLNKLSDHVPKQMHLVSLA